MSIDGTAGNDSLDGTFGDDVINGFAGNDTLRGLAGNDILNGGDDNDLLLGGGGNDTLNGGAGDDTLKPLDQLETSGHIFGVQVNGGSGVDRAILIADYFRLSLVSDANPSSGLVATAYSPSFINFTLTDIEVLELAATDPDSSGTFGLVLGTGGADLLSAGEYGFAEIVFGGDGNDTLYGAAFDDSLVGNADNDILNGAAGDDTIDGGTGADTLTGGTGSDTFFIGSASDIVGGGDVITDLSVDDYLVFWAGSFDFETSHFIGNSAFNGLANEIRFQVGGGQTVVQFDQDGDGNTDGQVSITNGEFSLRWRNNFYDAFQIAQTAAASAASESIYGTVGDDTLDGLGGDDYLDAMLGDDVVVGGDGNDTLYGGEGADTLTGGAGADGFAWSYNYELGSVGGVVTDVITDLDPVDTIFLPTAILSQLGADFIFLNWIGTSAFSGTDSEFRYEKIAGRTEVQFDIDGDGATDHIIKIANGEFDFWVNSNDLRIISSGIATAGDDSLAGTIGADTINGLGGDDYIVGWGGDDFLDGGADNDTIDGSSSNDTILGGSGDDFLIGGYGADSIDGGAGNDTASYAGSSFVNVSLMTGSGIYSAANGDTLSGIENLQGSSFSDTLYGDDSDNILSGGYGLDKLFGNGGSDTLNGDTDDDSLDGGSDADMLYGGEGEDLLDGGAGADEIDGGLGVDTVTYANATSGVVINLSTGTGSQNIAAGDTFSNVENIFGSVFNDLLIGANGESNLIQASIGNDTLYGLSGDDTLDGGIGADAFYGGGGVDTVTYASSGSGVFVRLGTNQALSGHAQGDTFSSIENVIGSAFRDILVGDTIGNALFGGAGNDDLWGLQGVDTLAGDEGDDLLTGAAGNDALFGGLGDDTLSGGAGGDALNGGAGVDLATYYGAANGIFVRLDTGVGSAGQASGDTFASIENIRGTNHRDIIIGDGAANMFIGEAGNDDLYGGSNNDELQGRAGDDHLFGQTGDDTLAGGTGADTMTGGAGDDAFVFATGDGADVITDFAAGAATDDIVSVSGFGAAFDTFAEVIAAASQAGADVVINFGGGDTLTLQNVTLGNLDTSDFVFG